MKRAPIKKKVGPLKNQNTLVTPAQKLRMNPWGVMTNPDVPMRTPDKFDQYRESSETKKQNVSALAKAMKKLK